MSLDISTSSAQAPATLGGHFLRVALVVAALANALVPAVFFSETHFFGQTAPRERALVAAVVLPSFIEALRSKYGAAAIGEH